MQLHLSINKTCNHFYKINVIRLDGIQLMLSVCVRSVYSTHTQIYILQALCYRSTCCRLSKTNNIRNKRNLIRRYHVFVVENKSAWDSKCATYLKFTGQFKLNIIIVSVQRLSSNGPRFYISL